MDLAPAVTIDDVRAALRPVEDPELHRSIVDLGMVREVVIDGYEVTVTVALTVAGCPLKEFFHREIPARLHAVFPQLSAIAVQLTTMGAEERAAVVGGIQVPKVGQASSRTRIVAVGSGKGGVGKSTVAVNLAAALAASGHSVGLLDADVWGFSIPSMLNMTSRPTVVDELIMPLEAHGMKVLSMGNFIGEDQPVVWRGPMLHKALQQLLSDVHWDDREFLIVDMPPGTGDVAISLSQFLPGMGFLLVTTPQQTACLVALRAARMMQKAQLNLLGVVENMAGFVCEGCGRFHQVFGEGGAAQVAQDLGVPVLASIPLDEATRRAADSGIPLVLADPRSAAATAFAGLAATVVGGRSRERRQLPLLTS